MLPKPIQSQIESQMTRTVEKTRSDFATLRTGRANASLLEGIRVDYYGTPVPLKQIANIGTPEARTLEIRPWDKSSVQAIEKAIQKSDLGLTPNNDGSVIRLQIPALTEERRKDLIKVVRKMTEEYRVSLRNERRDAVERLKKSHKAKEISEDDLASGEAEIQKLTDRYIKEVDELLASKERDIMEV